MRTLKEVLSAAAAIVCFVASLTFAGRVEDSAENPEGTRFTILRTSARLCAKERGRFSKLWRQGLPMHSICPRNSEPHYVPHSEACKGQNRPDRGTKLSAKFKKMTSRFPVHPVDNLSPDEKCRIYYSRVVDLAVFSGIIDP